MSERIKLGFVLLSNTENPIPSTRIVVLNMLPFLRAAGFDPHIVFEHASGSMTPDVSGLAEKIKAKNIKIVIFQKVFGESVLSLAKELRQVDIKTIFSICDLVIPDLCQATDATIVVTNYLKSLYPKELQSKISVVHDGIEHPQCQKSNWSTNSGSASQPLKAVLVTSFSLDRLPLLLSPPDWIHITIVGRYPASHLHRKRWQENRWALLQKRSWRERLDYLKFLANRRIKCEAWGPDSVYDHLLAADIGIIPIQPDPDRDTVAAWKVKSENRLTLMMATGLPVVATPIPSYEEVIEQGVNGYLAQDISEWMKYLSELRDPELRRQIGLQARRTALERYSMDLQAKRLIAVLNSVHEKDACAQSTGADGNKQ